MKLTHEIFACVFVVLLPAAFAQQPEVSAGGVLNAASYGFAGLPNAGVAQGSIFVVFGKRMGPETLVSAGAFPLPTELQETSISVKVGDATVKAIMLYTSAGQLAGILPSNTPRGTGTLTVTYRGQTSAPASIEVVESNFGIFTRNQAGGGPAWVQHIFAPADSLFNSLTNAGKPGDYFTIYGTGVGGVDFDETRPPQVKDLPTNVEVLVGGKRAMVLYKGRSAQFPGLDQINFQLSDDAPEGCYVPLAVKAGNKVSNFTTMAVSRASRVCSDPTGFSAADLERIQGGAPISLGAISLGRIRLKLSVPGIGDLEIKTDSGSAVFERYNANGFLASGGGAAVLGYAPFGSCMVFTFRGTQAMAVDPIQPDQLDAGTGLTISGPGGIKQIRQVSRGVYSAQLGGGGGPGVPGEPDYFQAGTHAVDNGAGGSDVGPFRATITVPQPFVWTNQDSTSNIPRSLPLSLTWSGGDPTQNVFIFGYSARMTPEVGAGFICTERVSKGQFTVSPEVLSAVPSSEQRGMVPTGALMLSTFSGAQSNRFQATGLDLGFTNYADSILKNVNFQ